MTLPKFKSVKYSGYLAKNHNIPENFYDLNELPEDHDYYKTKDGKEKFLLFKNDKITIFQSPTMAKIMLLNPNHLFSDGTFSSSPKDISYQNFLLRVFDDYSSNAYTVVFALLKNKDKETYRQFFQKINDNIDVVGKAEFKEEYDGYSPVYIHSDYEDAIQLGAREIWLKF